MLLYNILIGSLMGTLAFSTYITLSPGMKGIVFRNDDQGNIRFVPFNIVRLAIAPLYNKDLWNPNLWNINYIIYILGSCIVYRVVFNGQDA